MWTTKCEDIIQSSNGGHGCLEPRRSVTHAHGGMCVWVVQHSDTTILAAALDRSKEWGYLWPGLGNVEHE